MNGFFHLPYSDLKQVPDKELVEHISRLLVHCQTEHAILAGRDGGELLKRAEDINDRMAKYSGGYIKLVDAVQMGPDNRVNRSWFSEKMRAKERVENRGQGKYRNPHMRVATAGDSVSRVPFEGHTGVGDIQVAVRGSEPFLTGHIRCSINGVQQMFREMKPADFQRWRAAAGPERTELEHVLSLEYFRESLDNGQEQSNGVKR